MSEGFTPDRFDEPVSRKIRHGVHRAPRRGIARLSLWAWALIVTVALSTLGIGTIISIDRNLFTGVGEIFPDFQVTASPSVDADRPLTVLNGSGLASNAQTATDELEKAGFVVAATTAADSTVKETIVYYSTEDAQAGALAVVQTLGVGRIDFSDAYGYLDTEITVVLGSDYVFEG